MMNNETAQSNPSGIASQSVDSIIRESKLSIEQGMVKRGRGRPRKDAAISSPNGPSIPGNSSNSGQVSQGHLIPSNGPAIDIPVELLQPVIELPFQKAALKTGFDGWALSKEEAQILAKQLDLVLKQYLPAMNSPHAAAYTLAGSLIMFAGVRYMMYMDWKKEELKKMDVKNATNS